jgi:hypothetical protein
MLDNFRRWYLRNHTEITWFLIGFLIMSGLINLGQGDYLSAVLTFGVAWINYFFSRK